MFGGINLSIMSLICLSLEYSALQRLRVHYYPNLSNLPRQTKTLAYPLYDISLHLNETKSKLARICKGVFDFENHHMFNLQQHEFCQRVGPLSPWMSVP